MNKHTAVLECLKKTKKGITSLEAIEMFGATRLSAIIFDLKDRGYIIKDNFEECVDRFGNTARYKRYWLVGSCYEIPRDKIFGVIDVEGMNND